MANVPILTPTPYTPPPTPALYTPPQTTLRPTAFEEGVNDLLNYLDNVKKIPKSVSPRLKKLQEKIKSIFEEIPFEVIETDSALSALLKYILLMLRGYLAHGVLWMVRVKIQLKL